VLLQLEEYADAEVHLARAMEWYDTDARRNDPYRLETIGLLAFVLWKVDKLDEADELAQMCIGEQTDLLGEGDEETLRSKWVLAGVREKQGKLEEALEMYKRTIEGAEKWLGESSEVAKEWRGDCEALLEKMEKSAANAEGTTRVMKRDETCGASVRKTMSQDSLEDAISGTEEGRREMPLVDEKIRQEGNLQPSQVILVV
jgi:tetratricopeptide (TPR) repeat protein